MSATLFLGIDQSLNGTGICLLTSEGALVSVETVNPGSRRGAERLAYIKSRVVVHLGANVAFAGIEGYAYHAVGRVFELGEVGGVLRLLLYEHSIAYADVAPVQVKKFATGSPAAKKEAVILAAEAEGILVADDNQADAYFLALIAKHVHTQTWPATRARMDVICALSTPSPKKAPRRIRTLAKNTL